MPVGLASEYYLRGFTLPSGVVQMVSQRVQARIAGEELTAQYDEPLPHPAETSGAPASPFPEAAAESS